tara:strand:+ start:351 stop:647 length:297 start_codon:yes stop_codon:yes gene_type:complete
MSKKEPMTSGITEQEIHHNPLLSMVIEKDSELKTFLVDHVGTKFDKEEVTVDMICEALAIEFPEFMYAMAEENFLLGYKEGLKDVEKLHDPSATKVEE